MSSNVFELLEQALINVTNSDHVEEATKIIEDVSKTDEYFNMLIEILFQSEEPNAKDQASIQLYIGIKAKQRYINNTTKDDLKKSMIIYINKYYQNTTRTILNNIKECIKLFVDSEKQVWPELNQYIDECSVDPNPFRISILETIIYSLPPQFIIAKYELYCHIASLAIISFNDFDIMTDGISILAKLISSSSSLNGFELAFSKIYSIISQYLEVTNLNQNSQIKFWKSIREIIENGIFPLELVSSIVKIIMNQNAPTSTILMVLESINPAIKNFTLDQMLALIRQIIFFSAKFMSENEDELPNDFMNFIEDCFKHFSHSQIYEYLKSLSIDLHKTNATLSILLFSPIISGAFEQVVKDIDYLIEILKTGFQNGNKLAIESCTTVLASMSDYSQLVSKCFGQLFPVILPLLVSPDEDIRSDGFTSMQSIFIVSEIKNDISIVTSIWNCRSNISPDNYSEFFDLLGIAISCSKPLNDSQVHEILQFIQPLLVASDNPSYEEFASASLYIIGQLISQGEFAEIEKFIPLTLDPIKNCLQYDNEDIKLYTLSYIVELVDSYGESITKMLEVIWPFIEKLIMKNKFKNRIMELSLKIACKIAVLFKQDVIIQKILLALQRVYKKKYYEIFAKCSVKLLKIIDPNIYQSFFAMIIKICLENEDEEIVGICFNALEKFLKYAPNLPEDYRIQTIEKSAQLISQFFNGSLQCLDEKSILKQEEIDSNLVGCFSDFLGKFLTFQSQYIESFCQSTLKMAAHDDYKNFVIEIFIDAIEACTVPENVSRQLIEGLQPFMLTKDEDVQQNIVFLMILILIQSPTFINSLEPYLHIVTQWWSQCMTDTTRYSLLIDNIASLFLRIESMTSSIPSDVLEQLMDFFPPSSVTETQRMLECILIIFQNANSNPQENAKISAPSFRLKTAIGLAKLLTEPAKKIRKMDIKPETNDSILVLFRFICQDQEIARAVEQFLANNEKRHSVFLRIMNQQ
ncbi:hypothetical protein M9Y10_021537 [Tritrichomonas musculus]|uniref:Importin N-terminal domain-containing protein n=1 Tax=Tritrichomonas musculus TaxID=1915356 RepID=A0ABR2KPR1_9EUKA